ncbi:MAG: DcrB-related protein [Deltaproteobacteria bacterium]|nr:DcrB-related protein [Deltaproteobacteria bacterium]
MSEKPEKHYLWRDLRFELPAGVVDDTLLAFKGPAAAFSLTVARELLGASTLELWARAQEQAMGAQKLPAYVGEAPRPLPAPEGAKAVVVDRRFNDGSGSKLFQRQAFVALGPTVAIVTATSRDPAAEQAKQAVVDVVNTLRRAP